MLRSINRLPHQARLRVFRTAGDPVADQVGRMLRAVNAVPSIDGLRLEPIPRNPGRLDYLTRACFQVYRGEQAVCHLTVGPALGDLWNRTQGFAAACPAIACRPLFWEHESDRDYLGVEFFEGTSLESLVLKGRMSPDAALHAAGKVVAALEATFEASNSTDLARELDWLLATVEATPLCCSLKRQFLREVVFPFVREGVPVAPLRTRWSNGDLVPRNVLVNSRGEVRLVDCELASRTHLYGTDYWRWRTYSQLPPEAQTLAGSPDDEAAGTWWDTLAILQQLVIVRKFNDVVTAQVDAGAKFRQMVGIMVRRRPACGANLLFPMLRRPADLLSGRRLRCHAQLFWKVVSRKFSKKADHGWSFVGRPKTTEQRKYRVPGSVRS